MLGFRQLTSAASWLNFCWLRIERILRCNRVLLLNNLAAAVERNVRWGCDSLPTEWRLQECGAVAGDYQQVGGLSWQRRHQ
jgi:hypothetical protein